MAEDKNFSNGVLDSLAQVRDELKVQMHLAKSEAKDEWDNLEEKWQDLKGQSEKAASVAGDTAQDVGTALGLAAEELKKGYDRFKKLF